MEASARNSTCPSRAPLLAHTRRDVTVALVAGAVVGLCIGLGRHLYSTGFHLNMADWHIYAVALVVMCAVALLIMLAFGLWDRWNERPHMPKGFSARIASLSNARRTAMLFAVVFVLWIPAFLAFFPGNYSSDGPLQVSALLNGGYIDGHWPAVHTLVLTGCLQAGNALFGSYNAGLSVYCILQAALLAFAMSFAASRLVSWRVPVPFVLVATAIMVLNPVVQAYAFTTTKDSFFAAFFLVALVCMVEVVRDPEASFADKRLLGLTFAAIFLMCLMRKQGMYVGAVAGVAMLIFLKTNRLRQAILWFAPIICAMVFTAALAAVLPTVADSSREVLSVPSQQIARVYEYDRDSLSEDDIAWISRYYDVEGLDGYLEPISDPAKGALIESAYATDKLDYLALWCHLGSSHPGLYAEAFFWGCIGYTYPSAAVFNRWTGLSPWNEFGITLTGVDADNQITQNCLLPGYYQYLYDGTWWMFPNNKLLTLWVHPALPFFVLLLCTAFIVRNKRYRYLLPLSFPGVYWLSLILGPVMCIRYVAPLFYCAAFIIALPMLAAPAPYGAQIAGRHVAGRGKDEAAA